MNLTDERGLYIVTVEQAASNLPVGTVLGEIRRFEEWDHPACIDGQIRSILGKFLVGSGPRAGQTVTISLESGWEGQEPFPSSRPNWIARFGEGSTG